MSNRLTVKTFNQICENAGLERAGWNLNKDDPISGYWAFFNFVKGQKEVAEWRKDCNCAWIWCPGEKRIESHKVNEFKVMLNQAIEKWNQAYIKEQMVELEREIEKLD